MYPAGILILEQKHIQQQIFKQIPIDSDRWINE